MTMASVLRSPWIRSKVEEELTTALDKFKDVYVPGEDLQRGHYHYHSRSGSVVVRLNRSRRVQFLKAGGGGVPTSDNVLC